MPIGVVSDDDFALEVKRSERSPVPSLRPSQISTPTPTQTNPTTVDGLVKDIHNGGRNIGDTNVPESLRKLIGEEANTNGRAAARNLAANFNVSDSSVSAYTNGATSTKTYNKRNKEMLEFINAGKLKLANRARSRLASTLRQITDNKLENADLKDLASIAKAMSGIVKDMTPLPDTSGPSGGQTFNGPSIIMYNPGFQKEEMFDTVDMQDESAD